MFDREFFKKNQKTLLWLLNSKLTKHWFRWVLRIHKDCPNSKIIQITPNSFAYEGKLFLDKGKLKAELKMDLRTHSKFSKRIYYAFKPLWAMCHYWDILIANNFFPAFNLGFDQTYYPQAGNGGANVSTDAYCEESQAGGVSWATITGGTGTGATQDSADLNFSEAVAHAANVNQWVLLRRTIATIDTSAIGATGAVTAATLSFKGGAGSGKDNTTGGTGSNCNVYAAAPASNISIVAGDFDSLGTTAYCDTPISYTNWSEAGYNDFVFNATGIAAIVTNGISKFGLRSANHDVAGTQPTWTNSGTSRLTAYSADQTGTASDPKLVVTLTITVSPSAGSITLTGQVPTITATITINPSNGTITLTGQVPTITKTGGWDWLTKNTASWTNQNKS